MRRREGAKAKKEQKQQCEKCKKKERLRARTRQRRRDLGTPAAKVETEKKSSAGANVTWSTGGKHEARRPESGPPPCCIRPALCFYPAVAPSSLPLVKEQLHLYSPKITFDL